VQPFPPTRAKHLVTPGNGREPLWSPDSKQLFYVVQPTNELVAVDIRTEPSFDVGKPVVIPKVRLPGGGPGRSYDITPDGKQFVVVMPASAFEGDRKPQEQIDVVLNWFEELRQRVPIR
jgi:Tol biopolymer transport system component